MNNLIKKLWDYKYNPAEKHIVCLNEIKAINNEITNLESEFLSKLNKNDKLIFNKITSKYLDLLEYLLFDAYLKGVKFSGKLFTEILKDD